MTIFWRKFIDHYTIHCTRCWAAVHNTGLRPAFDPARLCGLGRVLYEVAVAADHPPLKFVAAA